MAKSSPAKVEPLRRLGDGRGGARPGAGRKKNMEVVGAYEAYNKARAKREIHNARIAEYEEKQIAGTLVEAEAVKHAWQALISNARARLLTVPRKMAPLVTGKKSVNEIEGILTDAIHEALLELAGNGDH
jgi:hypothetical protein